MAQPLPDFAQPQQEGNEHEAADMSTPKKGSTVPAVQQPGCSAIPGTTSSGQLALLLPALVFLLLRRRRL